MLFNPEINSIEEDILYHETQIKEAQERLDRVKVSQAFSDAVISSLEDFLDNTDPFLYEILRGHINEMFEGNKLTFNNDLNKIKDEEDEIEYLEEGDPNYKSIEQLQQEDPDTVVATLRYSQSREAVFHSEEHLKSKGITPTTKEVKKEFGPLSYYELTGKPDTRPDKFEELAPNITYSSSGRAYVGFNDPQEAEEFRDAICEPSMFSESETMNGFKYEVKFYCSREYVQQIADSVNSMSDDPVESFEEINPRVIYNHQDKAVYIGMTAKNRCDYYGQVLTGQLTVGEKYTYSSKPSFINAEEYKYELRITEISLDDAVKLADLNLQKDPEHKDNRELLSEWRETRKREIPSVCKPRPKAVALEDITLGEIVSVGSNSKQYKVIDHVELDGMPHLQVIATYNSDMPELVGQTSYLKEAYQVLADDIQVDSTLQDRKEKTPVMLKEVKKSEVLSEADFLPAPYKRIPLDQIEVCDIVSTGTNVKGYYEIYQHCGDYVLGKCLYHDSLKMRIGQDGYYIKQAYLVEKGELVNQATAA